MTPLFEGMSLTYKSEKQNEERMMKQRQCIILEGDAQWCEASSAILLEQFDTGKIIFLSKQINNSYLTITQKQAQQYLGKEFEAVIFDALAEFNPDSLATITGTIKQAGVLVIWLGTQYKSLFIERFLRIAEQWGQTRLISGDQITNIEIDSESIESDLIDLYLTTDQQQAVQAIKKVVYGHRRRPLVLSADRGRGKSASLGLAAAELLLEGKQRILVTAPSLLIADTVFEHASRLLPEAERTAGLVSLNGAEIRFVAPDALIKSELKADLVLVDEAAAIPVAMLATLLNSYSRLVFSTTLQGYEGTGRGFAVRFQKILDVKTPNWHQFRMTIPIRWAENDILEQFSFQSLLLNAEPVADELISEAQIEHCQIEIADKKTLIDDERALTELFGLMVLAHYRTRPSDLQMLFDRDDMTIVVVRYQGHIIASAWLVNEGEFDATLSQAIFEGKRRLKGHLLPQSLLAHAGIPTAGSLKYHRIVRITVHPAIWHRKVGQTLLEFCIKHATDHGLDVIGTSFAMDDHLVSFWQKSAFKFARLGLHRDDVSGSHSVMMLRACSDKGISVVQLAKQRLQHHWPHLLKSQFNQLTAQDVISLSQLLDPEEVELASSDKKEIIAFAKEKRGYEFSQIAMWIWLSQKVTTSEFLTLTAQQQALCVHTVLQQQSWASIVKQTGFLGKSQAITALREAIAHLLAQ
jgi:tRNA(Met) cytidine acetyltransferase